MSRKASIILLAFVVATGARLRAQIVVIDPANLVQTILIAERTAQQYEQLRQEFEVIQRMAQKLGSLDRYRIPAISITGHDPSRWDYGKPWIQALNSGDARGTAYFQTAVPLERPRTTDLGRLSAAARRTFESQYATMEITDSVAMIGAHQVALVRNYFGKLQDAVGIVDLERHYVAGCSKWCSPDFITLARATNDNTVPGSRFGYQRLDIAFHPRLTASAR